MMENRVTILGQEGKQTAWSAYDNIEDTGQQQGEGGYVGHTCWGTTEGGKKSTCTRLYTVAE